MIRAIIIDDEPHCVTSLQHDLAYFCPQVEVVAACFSGATGIAAIEKYKPDLVFLDIEMPLMDGFELLEALEEGRRFQVIFTTAYDEFALKAIRVHAMDYLLKPIDGVDLKAAVNHVERHLKSNAHPDERITNLLEQLQHTDDQRIAIPDRDGYEFINISDIIYCRADGAYTHLVLTSDRVVFLSKALGEMESVLPGRLFMRIHHSTIVNIKKISHFKKLRTGVVVMVNGDQLNVSRSKRDPLLLKMGIK
ncbi:LytR/AlgR family response regulator transcription factor [Parapedobacter koreensis]|uniref:Two component transcriptional regulator, LytTR family n=1 Tax=Parapedobacter koreensis TaxID=332977 RepID=A0A1H7TMD4_9SPHI|nr:LytTR family DNA-binding domain-containing protein [Parapedobacter koreensis]SEL85007.1 two component transcriptional regulator, LytTR family [Parapedobacter koreensis]